MLRDILSEQAGVDPMVDRFNCGYIAAFYDVIRSEPEFIEESE